MAANSRLKQPRGSSSNPQAARNASNTAQNAANLIPAAAAELPPPSFHVDVAIAGGGIAGLALAAGLQARGIEAAVFEAAPAARRSNNSTGTILGVFSNGFKALEGLKPGLGDAVIASGSTVIKAKSFIREISADKIDPESACATSGGNSSGSATNDAATTLTSENRDGWVVREVVRDQTIVGWARAQEVLASSLTQPESIIHGHRVVAYHPVVTGKPVGNMSGGSKSNNDGAAPTGAMWKGLTWCLRSWVQTADPDGQLNLELQLTPFGGFGKPGVKDRLMCQINKNIADPSGHDTWHTILQAVTATDPSNIFERWMMDRPPPKDSWSDSKCGNRVVLMGDAAHAMHPGPGQGAQTAFEDAHQLCLCLADIKDVLAEPAAVAAAVREYEDRRIDRCVRIHAYATAARGIGEEGKLVKSLPPDENRKMYFELQKWVQAYPDKIKGDPESTYFK
ncbi:unnamed protein product [Closterium sp. Yama58-4]|nr:unnamed protein product [Closterium sp. Yama58-4]